MSHYKKFEIKNIIDLMGESKTKILKETVSHIVVWVSKLTKRIQEKREAKKSQSGAAVKTLKEQRRREKAIREERQKRFREDIVNQLTRKLNEIKDALKKEHGFSANDVQDQVQTLKSKCKLVEGNVSSL